MSIFGKPRSPSTASISFDVYQYEFQGNRDGVLVWYLRDGGAIGVYFFPTAPDLPRNAKSVEELRSFFTSKLPENSHVVECGVLALDGVQGVRLICKSREENSGAAVYLGSFTIPFRDFSFVIKIQCREEGTTGMREAILVAEALKTGQYKMEGERFVPIGWSVDDEQFDVKVPQHPLSRLRREMRGIASSFRIEAAVKKAAGFDLPKSNA